jgi:hypothetical protein
VELHQVDEVDGLRMSHQEVEEVDEQQNPGVGEKEREAAEWG